MRSGALIAPLLGALALGLAAAPALGAPPAGKFSGATEQERAVTFTLKAGKVRAFAAGVNTFCTTAGDSRFEIDALANIPPMPVRGGRFSYTLPGSQAPDGIIEMSVTGRIIGRTARGTITLTRPDSTFDASEGRVVFGICAGNNVTWTAKLKGKAAPRARARAAVRG